MYDDEIDMLSNLEKWLSVSIGAAIGLALTVGWAWIRHRHA